MRAARSVGLQHRVSSSCHAGIFAAVTFAPSLLSQQKHCVLYAEFLSCQRSGSDGKAGY